DGAGAALVADVPGGRVRAARQLEAEAGAGDLREGERLMPVHPAAAVLDVVPAPRRRPRAAAQPLARLEQQRRAAVAGRLPRSRDAGEPAAHHDHVVPAAPHDWYKCTRCDRWRRTTASESVGSRVLFRSADTDEGAR